MRNFSIIVARNKSGGIGLDGTIPWKCPGELAHFRDITANSPEGKINAIIMGRKTWESLPRKPLPDRLNIVLSRNGSFAEESNVMIRSSLDSAIQTCTVPHINKVFVIGGESLYREAIAHPLLTEIHVSIIPDETECDTFFPEIDSNEFYITHVNRDTFEYQIWNKTNLEELQYTGLIQKIFREGRAKQDRTGTGTISIFGHMMRFSLENNRIPVLTTKRVFWKGVVEELLWFLRGSTDNRELKDRGVHIWDRDCAEDTLKARGMTHLKEDDIGPGYSHQWRHFGADYVDCHTDYTGQGFDQIEWLIREIRTNPSSRRLLLTSWNPTALHLMCLPPCHYAAQFEVHDGQLSCLLTQRSCDVGLGVPFNISSYALLTYIIAHQTGTIPHELIYSMGDAHVYLNHVDGLKELIEKTPVAFPTISIETEPLDRIEDYKMEHFRLYDYRPHPPIKLPLSV